MWSRRSDRLLPHLFVSMPRGPQASVDPPYCAAGEQGYLSRRGNHQWKNRRSA